MPPLGLRRSNVDQAAADFLWMRSRFAFGEALSMGTSPTPPCPAKAGGITELCKVFSIAMVRNVTVMLHSFYDGPGLLAAIHATAALGGSQTMVEWREFDLEAQIYGGALAPKDGRVPVPQTTAQIGSDLIPYSTLSCLGARPRAVSRKQSVLATAIHPSPKRRRTELLPGSIGSGVRVARLAPARSDLKCSGSCSATALSFAMVRCSKTV